MLALKIHYLLQFLLQNIHIALCIEEKFNMYLYGDIHFYLLRKPNINLYS